MIFSSTQCLSLSNDKIFSKIKDTHYIQNLNAIEMLYILGIYVYIQSIFVEHGAPASNNYNRGSGGAVIEKFSILAYSFV